MPNNLAHFFQTLYNSKKTLQYISILSKGVFLIIWKLQLSKSKICPWMPGLLTRWNCMMAGFWDFPIFIHTEPTAYSSLEIPLSHGEKKSLTAKASTNAWELLLFLKSAPLFPRTLIMSWRTADMQSNIQQTSWQWVWKQHIWRHHILTWLSAITFLPNGLKVCSV